MSDPIWYRSLYFRIAFGFVALLATLLAVQGVVFLWMTGRMTELFPSRSPAQVAAAIAADVSVMLGDPTVTDLPGELNRQQQSSFRGFVVALADGRRDAEEDSLLRTVAPLLGVEDADSNIARRRVEARRT